MKTGEFSNKFDHNIVFGRIPYDFEERNEEDIEYAKGLSLGLLLDDYQPLLVALSKALAGERIKQRNFSSVQEDLMQVSQS